MQVQFFSGLRRTSHGIHPGTPDRPEQRQFPHHSMLQVCACTCCSPQYYVDLHFQVKYFNDYNHLGARLPLKHCNINVNKFRSLLPSDYCDKVICQYLEYGFPLGLQEDFVLKPVLKNHTGAYEFYSNVDKFICSPILISTEKT